jgi:hypothetical protein
MVTNFVNTDPQAFQQGSHGLYITDVGNIMKDHRFIGQKAGCQQGQGGVLIARWCYFTDNGMPPL